MALATRLKATKASVAFRRRERFVIFRAKKSGRKMKMFLMYWWGRINIKISLKLNCI